MVRHEHVGTNPGSASRAVLAIFDKCPVDGLRRYNLLPVPGAGRQEVNWRPHVDCAEPTNTSAARIFGGHGPPLQFTEPGEDFVVNAVEPAVAEDHHHVVRPEQRHQAINDGIGVLFIKGG